ncbi:hypothetical protein A7U60_g2959 [Sanghuangporus baumii]|uniref:Uncharacterized protein n=1 Tax=Sanghuangporus baumii TaxID=108892 RepID=A0A9Q5I1A9_SANBA|nr:hypothetical protein A7U60_g2959 [Sanghuangporus baumii]
MVVTRSITKKCAAGDGSSGATASTRSYHNDHSTCAVIHEDAVRGAVDNHASACSRGAKSNSALLPTFFREDKSARTRSRSGVPPGTTSHGSGRRPTRARKQPPSVQAITKKSSSKPEVRSNDSMNKCRATAILSRHASTIVIGSVEDRSEKEDKHHPSNRGVKRKRDEEEKVPTFAASMREHAAHSAQGSGFSGSNNSGNGIHDNCSSTVERRSARLAARSSVQDCKRSDRSRKTKGHENAPAKKKSVSRKRKRDHERANDVTEAPGPSRRVRGRALEGSDHSEGEDEGKSSSACGTSTESPQETLVNDKSSPLKTSGPGSDEASPLPSSLPMNEDLVSEPTRPSSRGLSRGRHIPSIEPLLTPPQYIKEEEEEIVLINQDLDTMIPLASRDAEEDGASVVLTHLPQLGDEERGDEQSIEADDDAHDHIVTNRYRSLAPEPDQGLINAIRSGEIPGLTSPPPSMHEAS